MAFWRKKTKTPTQEASPDLLERLLTVETKLRAIELSLDEQHDFIRRLASRRAKEDQVEQGRARGPARRVGPPGAEPTQEAETKVELRRRALSMLRPQRGNGSAE